MVWNSILNHIKGFNMDARMETMIKLVREAKKQYGDDISYCCGKDFFTSFTENNNRLLFWFNTNNDSSTHVKSCPIN